MELNTPKQIMYFDEAIRLHKKGYGKYRISRIIPVSESTILRWIHIFVSENKDNIAHMKKSHKQQTKITTSSLRDDDLLLEIERLRLALKKEGQRADKESSRANRESLRADAYNEIIKVAESKFNIKIRKKAGVKQ